MNAPSFIFHDTQLSYFHMPLTSPFFPPASGFWYVLPNYPNDLRQCLSQSPRYRQGDIEKEDTDWGPSFDSHSWLKFMKGGSVRSRRRDARADLVQLFGVFDDCGTG